MRYNQGSMNTPHYLQNSKTRGKSLGFTIIELLVVIVLALILASLVALTYSGVQAKNRNVARQDAIDTLQGQLEAFYAENSQYPALANLNDPAWRTANLKKLSAGAVKDPHWSKSTTGCMANGQPTTSAKPIANCYSYQVTAADGSACDNLKAACGHYTLTATLEGGEKYVKSSLN